MTALIGKSCSLKSVIKLQRFDWSFYKEDTKMIMSENEGLPTYILFRFLSFFDQECVCSLSLPADNQMRFIPRFKGLLCLIGSSEYV